MLLVRRGGARNQFVIHEVVHVFTVLPVLPGQPLLDGPRRGEVQNTPGPGEMRGEYRMSIVSVGNENIITNMD